MDHDAPPPAAPAPPARPLQPRRRGIHRTDGHRTDGHVTDRPAPPRGPQAAHDRPDQGQALVLVVLAAAALLVVVCLLLGTMGGVVNDRARARTAADGAALAGARAGRPAADAVAAANGGILESFAVEGDRTTVQVRVGRARASASATASWTAATTAAAR